MGSTFPLAPVGGDSLLVAQAGGGSCTRRGELKLRRKEEDCGKRGQREGHEEVIDHQELAFPKQGPGETSLEGHSLPHMPVLGALTASCFHVVPTHRLACALLMGDFLRAPEVDADFARLTPQALLGVSWQGAKGAAEGVQRAGFGHPHASLGAQCPYLSQSQGVNWHHSRDS